MKELIKHPITNNHNMRHIKLYEDWNINEGLSPVLYHATRLNNAVSILRDNAFHLTNTIGLRAERSIQKKFYYMSFSRSMTSGYYLFQSPYVGLVYFKINGDALGKRYKGFPVDYWSTPNGERDKETLSRMENEDRLVSDSPEVPNATSYIEEMYVYLGGTKSEYIRDEEVSMIPKFVTFEIMAELSEFQQSLLRKLILLSKSLGIPLYAYWRKKDLLMNNKDASIDLRDIDLSGMDDSNRRTYGSRTPIWVSLLYKMYRSMTLEELRESMTSEEGEKFGRFESWKIYGDDIVTSIQSDISNLRSSNNQIVNKVVSIMKREGFGSIREFLESMYSKWYGS